MYKAGISAEIREKLFAGEISDQYCIYPRPVAI
jgi:hypothetical protein